MKAVERDFNLSWQTDVGGLVEVIEPHPLSSYMINNQVVPSIYPYISLQWCQQKQSTEFTILNNSI